MIAAVEAWETRNSGNIYTCCLHYFHGNKAHVRQHLWEIRTWVKSFPPENCCTCPVENVSEH